MGRAHGIESGDLAACTAREQAALAYAQAMATANTVAGDLFARVRDHFNDDEIVELTAIIAWEICAAKFNRALEIEGQGICIF